MVESREHATTRLSGDIESIDTVFVCVRFVCRIAITKLDILDDLEEVKIGVSYLRNGQKLDYFPGIEQNNTFKSVQLEMKAIHSDSHVSLQQATRYLTKLQWNM